MQLQSVTLFSCLTQNRLKIKEVSSIVKLLRRLFSIVCVVMVLFASSLRVSAIGFNAEEKYNSVFVVTSGNSLGSGFAIGENCIVTNAHVLEDSRDIILTTYSGETHSAFLIGIDEDKDIAVLGVRNMKFSYLQSVDFSNMNTGDDVYAIGAPKSMAYTLTKGVISAKERNVGRHIYIQTDAAINEGNSGGPLINDEGNVIGINTMKMSNSEGIGLAIPMAVVSEFIKSLDIEIDANGNVPITITPEKEENNTNEGVKDDDGKDKENDVLFSKSSPFYVVALIVALCVSGGLNAILISMLVFQRKKNLDLKYDSRERTDFDIDILE